MSTTRAFTKYTRADRERVLTMRAQGVSRNETARRTGITVPTIQKWELEAKGMLPPSLAADEIEALKPDKPLTHPENMHLVERHELERRQWLADADARLRERFSRLSQEPRFDFYYDMLGDPPPHRSALWQKLMGEQA